MKIFVLFTLAATLQGAAFAQKTESPELRNEHATNPTRAQSHKSKSVTPVKSNDTSAAELAKIEQSGTRKTGTRKPLRSSKAANPTSHNGAAVQSKNKPAKFSYHPPQGKTGGNGGRTSTSARPLKPLH